MKLLVFLVASIAFASPILHTDGVSVPLTDPGIGAYVSMHVSDPDRNTAIDRAMTEGK
jgi:hypothetical protein